MHAHTDQQRATLSDILITPELARRTCKPPDFAAENRALVALAREMAARPENLLRKLTDLALELCHAGSAGISVLKTNAQAPYFHWQALSGAFTPYAGRRTPCDFSPCGVTLMLGATQLFSYPARHFDCFDAVEPPVIEALVVPLYADGEPLATIWVLAHDEQRGFDAEDARLLRSLGEFTGAAMRPLSSLDAEKRAHEEQIQANAALEQEIHWRRRAETVLRACDAPYRTLFDLLDEGFCVIEMLFDDNGAPVDYRFLEVNPTFERQTGLKQAVNKTARALVPKLEAHWFEVYGSVALTGKPVHFENVADAMNRWFDVYASRVGLPEDRKVAIFFKDITERKRTAALLEAHTQILEMIIVGKPLADILTQLARVVEQQSGGQVVASILLLNEDGHLRNGASPRLSDEFIQAVDGSEATATVGTCSAAAARNETVITPDIDADPQWQSLKHLVLPLGLRAVWSMPVRAHDGRVLATFGTYFREQREPGLKERQTVEMLTCAAALAIERKRAEEKLRKQHERQRLLSEAAGMLLSTHDADALFPGLFAKIAQHLEVDAYCNFMINEARDAVHVESYSGLPVDALQALMLLKFRQDVRDGMVLSGRPLALTNIQQSEDPGEHLLKDLGFRVCVCNPLMLDDRLLGVLWFASRSRNAFDEDELDFLKTITRYVTMAHERLQLIKQLRESDRRKNDALEELMIANTELDRRVIERTHVAEQRAAQLRAMASELTLAEERERQKLAHDLHDGLSQGLSLARLKLSDLQTSVRTKRAQRQLQGVAQLLRHANYSVRTHIFDLSPPVLEDFGLVKALEWLAEDVQTSRGLKVRVQHNDQLEPIDERIRFTLFRAARELLVNVAKHAGVDHATVAVENRGRQVALLVEDDGNGFDLADVSHTLTGFGLSSIRERLSYLGGDMHMESSRGHGARITLLAPVALDGSE